MQRGRGSEREDGSGCREKPWPNLEASDRGGRGRSQSWNYRLAWRRGREKQRRRRKRVVTMEVGGVSGDEGEEGAEEVDDDNDDEGAGE